MDMMHISKMCSELTPNIKFTLFPSHKKYSIIRTFEDRKVFLVWGLNHLENLFIGYSSFVGIFAENENHFILCQIVHDIQPGFHELR